ncbi:hypothetical protein B0H11DRAFT_1995966 [Mycena galericulata]|nr:hypothetical protein B0H11DRAFT_1995966 [Mycena galericulata]
MRASLTSVPRRIRLKKRAATPKALSLPLELQWLVLEQLADDVLQMRLICLVCSAWCTYAQPFIFREVSVTETTVLRLLALFHARPQLGICTTALRVVESDFHSPDVQPVLEQLLESMPASMPNVRTLHLLYWKFGTISDTLRSAASVVARITRLRLSLGQTHSVSTTADDILRFIALFPGLEVLEFIGYIIGFAGELAASYLPPRHLKRLALGQYFNSGPILAWLASSTIPVDDLHVGSWCGPVDSLLDKIRGTLHTLTLEEAPGRPIVYEISLGVCYSLQYLEIGLRFSTMTPGGMEQGLLSLLSELSAPSLSTIYLDTYVVKGHLDLPWGDVDAILEEFPNLREVVFDLYGNLDVSGGNACKYTGSTNEYLPTYAVLCHGMREKMVRSDARSILRFKCAGNGEPQRLSQCRSFASL